MYFGGRVNWSFTFLESAAAAGSPNRQLRLLGDFLGALLRKAAWNRRGETLFGTAPAFGVREAVEAAGWSSNKHTLNVLVLAQLTRRLRFSSGIKMLRS